MSHHSASCPVYTGPSHSGTALRHTLQYTHTCLSFSDMHPELVFSMNIENMAYSWSAACQPPSNGYTTITEFLLSFLLMFTLSGICRDKVAPLYRPWHFPGETDSGSIARWQSTSLDSVQIGMRNSDCLSDSLIYAARCSCPVWNWKKNSGTGWYHNYFHTNSSWEELWGGDWWCTLSVGGQSLCWLIQHSWPNSSLYVSI